MHFRDELSHERMSTVNMKLLDDHAINFYVSLEMVQVKHIHLLHFMFVTSIKFSMLSHAKLITYIANDVKWQF